MRKIQLEDKEMVERLRAGEQRSSCREGERHEALLELLPTATGCITAPLATASRTARPPLATHADVLPQEYSVRADLPQIMFRKLRQQVRGGRAVQSSAEQA